MIINLLIDSHPCWSNNGGCSHLCVGIPSVGDVLVASCLCLTGYQLTSNHKTCQSCKYAYTHTHTHQLINLVI